jgi:hypothetical protein
VKPGLRPDDRPSTYDFDKVTMGYGKKSDFTNQK